jgi:hypothetical protein
VTSSNSAALRVVHRKGGDLPMKAFRRASLASPLFLLVLGAVPASAAFGMPPAPEPKWMEGIPYVSGGVG